MAETRQETPDLTLHQKRILAALLALERAHSVRWWDRDAIGHVVAAGGYHNVIQRKTIAKLKELGLVQTERSSWPEETQQLVRCTCGCCAWGLTDAGRAQAESLLIKLPPETMKRIEWEGYQVQIRSWADKFDDSEDPRRRYEREEEDDA